MSGADEQPREQRNEGQGTFVNGSLHGGVWNIFVNHASQNEKQSPSAQEMLALGSVAAPFGRLPEAVLGRDGILTALTQPMDDPRIQVLSGMGGVGKTTVALSAAEQAKQAGAEVFWVQAGSAAAVADGMRHAALLAGAPAEHVAHAWEKGGRPAADLVWRHLANMDRPWLFVFDDADDLDVLSCPGAALADATGWVRPPVGKSYGVLVTTRDGNKRSWGDRIARCHQLDVLETKFAGQVLQELAPEAGDTDSARSLADRLGSLPLALHLAGAYLAMAHEDPLAEAQTFTDYVRVLDDSPCSSTTRQRVCTGIYAVKRSELAGPLPVRGSYPSPSWNGKALCMPVACSSCCLVSPQLPPYPHPCSARLRLLNSGCGQRTWHRAQSERP